MSDNEGSAVESIAPTDNSSSATTTSSTTSTSSTTTTPIVPATTIPPTNSESQKITLKVADGKVEGKTDILKPTTIPSIIPSTSLTSLTGLNPAVIPATAPIPSLSNISLPTPVPSTSLFASENNSILKSISSGFEPSKFITSQAASNAAAAAVAITASNTSSANAEETSTANDFSRSTSDSGFQSSSATSTSSSAAVNLDILEQSRAFHEKAHYCLACKSLNNDNFSYLGRTDSDWLTFMKTFFQSTPSFNDKLLVDLMTQLRTITDLSNVNFYFVKRKIIEFCGKKYRKRSKPVMNNGVLEYPEEVNEKALKEGNRARDIVKAVVYATIIRHILKSTKCENCFVMSEEKFRAEYPFCEDDKYLSDKTESQYLRRCEAAARCGLIEHKIFHPDKDLYRFLGVAPLIQGTDCFTREYTTGGGITKSDGPLVRAARNRLNIFQTLLGRDLYFYKPKNRFDVNEDARKRKALPEDDKAREEKERRKKKLRENPPYRKRVAGEGSSSEDSNLSLLPSSLPSTTDVTNAVTAAAAAASKSAFAPLPLPSSTSATTSISSLIPGTSAAQALSISSSASETVAAAAAAAAAASSLNNIPVAPTKQQIQQLQQYQQQLQQMQDKKGEPGSAAPAMNPDTEFFLFFVKNVNNDKA